MKNTGIRALAQQLQSMGRDGDTILAHIMPHEAAMLKRMGGRGSVNPKTGLLEFAEDSSSSNQSPSYGGGSSLSGFTGGGSSPGGVSGGGFSSSGGGSYTSSGGGGWTPSGGGGGGGGSIYQGGPNAGGNAGGMQTGGGGISPAQTAGGSGNYLGAVGGNSSSNFMQSLGVPTIVANAANAAQNIAGAAGQGLLNFSDWATGQYRQMMNPAVSSFPARPDLQEVASAAPTTQSNIDPITGRDYGLEATRRSIAWGELIGGGISSLRDALSAPQETAPTAPGFRSEAASGVYDFTPATPNVPTMVDPGGSGRMVSPTEAELFYEMQRERFADQYGTQPSGIPAPQPVESIRLDQGALYRGAEENRSPTEQIAAPQDTYNLGIGPYDFSALQTQPLPGTVYGPVTAFGVTPGEVTPGEAIPGQSVVATKQLIDAMRTWAPGTTKDMTDAQIKDMIAGGMPAGITFDPKTGSLVNTTGLSVDEAVQQFGDWKTKWFNKDVPISQFVSPKFSPDIVTPATTDFSVATGPAFTSQVAQNVAQSLDNEFENLTKSSNLMEVSQPSSALRSEVLSPAYDYTTPAPATRGITVPEQTTGNLPTFAQVPVGSPMAFPETSTAMQYEGQYQPPAPTGLPTFIEAAGINANSTPAQISGALANMSTRQIYNILDETERMRRTLESTTGPFKVRENAAVTRGVDPRLLDIARKESVSLPQGQYYEFTSGVRPGDTGVHSTGRALDVAIMTADGQRLPNYQNPVFFSNYEQPALVGRAIQQQIYPELANNYYWGGYFSGPKGVYGALDVMDRRIGGNRPLGGSWETGLTEKQAALWGLPAGVTQVAQTKGVTSPEATQAAIQEGKLSNLLEYTYSGLRSEILTEGYNPPSESVTGYRDALRALGYTEEQIDRVEGVSDLPATTATPSSANLLEESSTFPSIGGGGGGGSGFGGGGGTSFRPREETPVEQPPAPVYTTGMDLARQIYTPRLPAETLSPAYS